MRLTPRIVICVLLVLAASSAVRAEMVRFRYAPIDACGTVGQVPVGPGGEIGEQRTGFGLAPKGFSRTFRPNQMVTFRHPYNARLVTVPLTLPQGTPRLERENDRIIYNYGSYVVEARFQPDGAVDVIYNSGFLRPLVVE